MDPSKIREKIGRFRILVIGRANAGKTTILQRVCNTRDNPEIYNSAGEKIDARVLMASTERGEHDIENEMVFRRNPGFVFHDSRGFEAGGESEFDKVKTFIAARSKETRLKNQLHTIWYCIPMDEASRAFTQGEVKFFSQCDTGSIPVMVLFTKFDALYDVAYAELKSKGASMEEAEEMAPKHAEESFVIGPQLKFLYHSKDIRHPPKCHVCLPNMDKDDADCGPLIERTAATLHDEVVKQLFVSTQQTNLELCMKYAVERTFQEFCDIEITASKGHEEIIGRLGAWFPHIVAIVDTDYDGDYDGGGDGYDYVDYGHGGYVYDRGYEERRGEGVYGRVEEELDMHFMNKEKLYRSDRTGMGSRLLSVASGSSPLGNIVQLGSAAAIVFEHSFYILDKRRYLQDQQQSVPSFRVALEQYMASPHAAAVREGVRAAVQAHEEIMTTPARAYEEAVRTLPAWMAKLPFEGFKRKAKEAFERSKEKKKAAFERSKEEESLCSQLKAELIKTILEITLNHRLPRP